MVIAVLFGVSVVLELLVHGVVRWAKVRLVLAVCVMFTSLVAASILLLTWPNLFSSLIFLLGLYRALNMKRIVKHRMHEEYMRIATWRTTVIMALLQLLVAVAWLTWAKWHASGRDVWTVVTLVQLVIASILLSSTVRNLRRSSWVKPKTSYTDHDLPSVTVAIPARDETEDLKQCLLSVISSDYPKLEILVLDDRSQTRHTPDIINEFARDGVRFVQGREPDVNWLPKNQAYARLASEASGTYIIFCGVDIRFAPGSIRSLVTKTLDRKQRMISVLPFRHRELREHSSIIQAIRYCWELALPRAMLNRPPVLSSCWIVDANSLRKVGGFESVARAIVPESYFAKQFVRKDSYSFLRSDLALGIESNKDLADQRATAVRTRYPQLHHRPEHVAITSMLELAFLFLPLAISIGGFWLSIGLTSQLVAFVTFMILASTYELVVVSTRVNSWWIGLLAQPFAAITDILLLNYSMWRYEFRTVEWKGRDVEAPVMHTAKKFQSS